MALLSCLYGISSQEDSILFPSSILVPIFWIALYQSNPFGGQQLPAAAAANITEICRLFTPAVSLGTATSLVRKLFEAGCLFVQCLVLQ